MALQAVVKDINEVPEALRNLYAQVGDDYILEVDDKGYKIKLGEFRDNNIELVKQNENLKTVAEKAGEFQELLKAFEGIDPEAAREAMKTMQGIEDKKLIDAGQIDELVTQRLEQRTSRMVQDHDSQIKSLQKTLDESVSSRDTYKTQLSSHVIDNSLQSAVLKAAPVRPGALDDVLSRGRNVWKLNDAGKPEARDPNGDLVFGKDGKDPISMDEWAQDLIISAPFLFEGNAGGGAGGGSGSRGGEGGTISGEDQDSINANIEGIATGKVKVS